MVCSFRSYWVFLALRKPCVLETGFVSGRELAAAAKEENRVGT